MCDHAYVHKFAPDKLICWTCGAIISVNEKKQKKEIVLPPRIYDITPPLWEQIRPWPLMPFSVVKKYDWYISMLFGADYLVMPVVRDGKPMFYSARRLPSYVYGLTGNARKYLCPKDVGKVYWQSKRKLTEPILISEGIADAAYLSQLSSSVALLGPYYDGSLNKQLDGKLCLIVMDGDEPGVEAAFSIDQSLRREGHVKLNVVMLPTGKDPTDLVLNSLRRIIKFQTGVEL